MSEPGVERPQRVLPDRPVLSGTDFADHPAQAEELSEHIEVVLRHAEEIGDGQHRERLAVRRDELARAVGDELVELSFGQPPHELLVVPQAFRRDQAQQQAALAGVLGGIHRHHVFVHRERVAVLGDDVGDVITLDRDRERRKRPDDGVARREVIGVAVDVPRLLVAGHGDDPQVGQ